MRFLIILLMCFATRAHAGFYQRMLHSIELQMDRYFILRSSDQACTNMFIHHIDTVNRLMSSQSDQSIRSWNRVGITPHDGDKRWYQYLKKHELLVENDNNELTYDQLLNHIQFIKGNAGLFFQSCLKAVWPARLSCSRQFSLDHRQEINECIKKQEELINLKQISTANYFNQLEEKEREEILKHAKELASTQQTQDE